MEKKTIGSFISILRRAHGMTQKELGEKLFVSDKTVSRWERDECAPDLSLIPVIADLFGVTADELLRGERMRAEPEGESEPSLQKSERQYRYLLEKRSTSYKNMLLISSAIAALGTVAALICNLGFAQARLGFGLGLVFLIAGAVTLFCSFNHHYLQSVHDQENDAALRFNTSMIEQTRYAVLVMLAIGGILLPLLFCPAYMGLTGKAWLFNGGVTALALWSAASFLYSFFLKIHWMEKGIMVWDEAARTSRNNRMRLLKRIAVIGLSVAAVLLLGFAVSRTVSAYSIQRPIVLNSFEELRTLAISNDVLYSRTDQNQILLANPPNRDNTIIEVFPSGSTKPPELWEDERVQTVYDHRGEPVYRVLNLSDFIRSIEFSFSDESPEGMPIRVYTQETLANAQTVIDSVSAVFLLAIAVDGIVCVIVYCKKRSMNI